MPRVIRLLVLVLGMPLAAAPAAIAATLLFAPAWEWFEDATGVQAYGHHGPAEWCYVATYGVMVATGYVGAFASRMRRRAARGVQVPPHSHLAMEQPGGDTP